MGKNRYLFISSNYPPTICGVGDYTFFLSEEFKKVGIDVHCLTSSGQNSTKYAPEIHPLIRKFALSELIKILKEVKGLKPCVINFQYVAQMTGRFGFSISIGLLAILIRLFTDSKLIVTFHELFIPITYNFLMWPIALVQRINLFIICLAANTLITTTSKKKRILQIYALGKSVSMIPVGSNIAIDPTKKHGIQSIRKEYFPDDGPLFVSFGTSSREKDYIKIIKLIVLLGSNGMNSNLLLIGDLERDAKVYSEIRKFIDDNDLSKHVVTTGSLSSDRISKLLLESDFFIICQKKGISTGSGTLAAALAHSIPVIANLRRGVDDIFKNNYNIFFVDMENLDIASKELVKIIQSDDMIAVVKKNADLMFMNEFSWGSISKKILQLTE